MTTRRNLVRSKVYLCGQIENDVKNCATWRKTLTADLESIEPEIIVWDPLIKPAWMSPDSRDHALAFDKSAMFGYDLRDEGCPPHDVERGRRAWAAAHEIRSVCKKLVSSCDFVIARVTKTFTWGSIDELEIAAMQNKPVFFWFPEGPVSTYGIPGCVPNFDLVDSYVFYEYEELLRSVRAISDGTSRLLIDDPYAWTYITYTNAVQ